jgi:hypothetical protein
MSTRLMRLTTRSCGAKSPIHDDGRPVEVRVRCSRHPSFSLDEAPSAQMSLAISILDVTERAARRRPPGFGQHGRMVPGDQGAFPCRGLAATAGGLVGGGHTGEGALGRRPGARSGHRRPLGRFGPEVAAPGPAGRLIALAGFGRTVSG